MTELKSKLQRVEIAGELLAKASITKTKKAAQSLGDETLELLGLLVETIEVQAEEIKQLKQQEPLA